MMPFIRLMAVMILLAGAVSVPAHAQPQPKPPPQHEEFVPIDQLPPGEEMPAAPMVVAAYVFIWIAFIGYVFPLVKRVRRVESDLRNLEQGRRP